jgi:predicted glutamate--cysteine ligase
VYTGTPAGEIEGLSDKIVADLDRFVREPDSRNVEYTTAPLYCYDRLLCDLVRPRQELRHYLHRLGNYTLIPGSSLHLEMSDRFYRSDPGNPYHTYIEQTYGTQVVTASVHINVGIPDPEVLMRACRLVRVEAPLYLALSAASPFLKGQPTGYHSSRWHVFPQTPKQVPLFSSHAHFIEWTHDQLALGTMQNVRHLWCSVRPNGDSRPYNLNRLELRICDLIADPIALLAVTALLEARLWQMFADPKLDPLVDSPFSPQELVDLSLENERKAAQHSLNAELRHWQSGQLISARDWIQDLYEQVWAIAKSKHFSCFLAPVKTILWDGNAAQQWLVQYDQGLSCQQIIQQAIQVMEQQEFDLADKLCFAMAA